MCLLFDHAAFASVPSDTASVSSWPLPSVYAFPFLPFSSRVRVPYSGLQLSTPEVDILVVAPSRSPTLQSLLTKTSSQAENDYF